LIGRSTKFKDGVLTTREIGDVVIVDAIGRITQDGGAPVLRDTIRDLVDRGSRKILLNFASIDYVDSVGVGELVSGFTIVTTMEAALRC
jgi:anti-sigma B factor antagonist